MNGAPTVNVTGRPEIPIDRTIVPGVIANGTVPIAAAVGHRNHAVVEGACALKIKGDQRELDEAESD